MSEANKGNQAALSREQTANFKNYLKRLFGLPIQRTTIREFHSNLARFVHGDEKLLKDMMEAFIKGTLPADLQAKEHLRNLIEEFSPLVRLAKDVHDRGDFLNFVTSDQISYEDRIVFNHYIRSVDGTEARFVTDIPTLVQLIHHLSQRLADASDAELSQKALEDLKPILKDIQTKTAHTLEMAKK